MTIDVEVAALTSTGSRHGGNQDRVTVGSMMLSPELADGVAYRMLVDEPFLVAVFDGMGGHDAGGSAATAAAWELVRHATLLTNGVALGDAIELANRRVYDEMTQETSGMGSTVCAIAFQRGQAVIGNVGDSPCFADIGGFLVEMTTADANPATGRLTQSLGGLPSYVAVEPHLFDDDVVDRRFLLMSDGISGVLEIGEMEACLDPDPLMTARQLVEAARARGSTDDASIVVVRVVRDHDAISRGSTTSTADPVLPVPVLPPRSDAGALRA